MITTKIFIRAHICEYAIGKFSVNFENPIHIPDRYDLYHTIWDLMSPRPADRCIDKGNLEITLPDRNARTLDEEGKFVGKNPDRFNYLSVRAAHIIEFKLETMLFAELHEELDEQKHRHGIEYQETIHTFMCRYMINSITEDALLKNYYRWRKTIKRRKETRSYNRQS